MMKEKTKTKFKETEVGMIPEDWEVKPIKAFCSKITSGGTPSRSNNEYWNNGTIPWIKTQELKDANIYWSEEKINELGLENSSAKLFPPNTVLMALYGATVGKLGILRIEATTNQAVCAMIVNSDVADYSFLFYSLLNKRKELINLTNGAAQQNLNQEIVKEFRLAYPNSVEQRAISRILSALDYRIELNQQMNKTLEEMSRAIFKHWFIDFEFPNEEGKPYKSSGGEMVYNEELGKKIPKGWEVSDISHEFNLIMGQSPPGNSYNELGQGVLFFQGRADFGFRFPTPRVFCTKPTRFAKKGDTLVSVRAPVGDVNLALQDCCIGRGLAAIRHKSNYSSYTFYSMSNLKPIFDNFEAEGTVFGSMSKSDFEKIKIICPPTKLIDSFEKCVAAIDKKIEENTLTNGTLTSIRDSLLPKLMSGKIRVPVEAL